MTTRQVAGDALSHDAAGNIVVSADASAVRTGRELGAVASMVKPVDFDVLLRHVDQYC